MNDFTQTGERGRKRDGISLKHINKKYQLAEAMVAT